MPTNNPIPDHAACAYEPEPDASAEALAFELQNVSLLLEAMYFRGEGDAGEIGTQSQRIESVLAAYRAAHPLKENEHRRFPSVADIYGIDPDFTNGMSSDEYIRSLRSA